MTDTSRSLTRLGGRLRALAPLARRIVDGATSGIDDWMTGKLGEEFNERLARVPLNLTATGVDEFGLDPQWTKYALASVAFLHRKYFRTEIFGKEHVPAGRVLLISNHSGQIPIDVATNAIPAAATIEDQTKLVIENLRAVLAANGMTLDDVVSTQVFMKDLNEFSRMNQVYGMYFKDAPGPLTATRSPGLIFVMALCPVVLLEMGLFPGFWLGLVT